MSDYVKREPRTFIEISDDLNDLLTELNDKIVESIWARTADVAPVRHGRWIDMNTPTENYFPRYKCSVCGHGSDFSNFCPNCGARMDGEENDG